MYGPYGYGGYGYEGFGGRYVPAASWRPDWTPAPRFGFGAWWPPRTFYGFPSPPYGYPPACYADDGCFIGDGSEGGQTAEIVGRSYYGAGQAPAPAGGSPMAPDKAYFFTLPKAQQEVVRNANMAMHKAVQDLLGAGIAPRWVLQVANRFVAQTLSSPSEPPIVTAWDSQAPSAQAQV